MNAPTVIDLFAGAGGLSRGFLDSGFEVAKAVEIDPAASATYAATFGRDHLFSGPVEEFHSVPRADVVVGGPPCQGFSMLGKRDPGDRRNDLFLEFMRVTDESGADFFVFENVAAFARSTQYQRLLDLAEESNFQCRTLKLNAADFGTPQRRVRTVILGSRRGLIPEPAPTHHQLGAGGAQWIDLREAIGHLPLRPASSPLPKRLFTLDGRGLAGAYELDELHVDRTYRPASIARYDHVPPGGNRHDVPEDLQFDCWRRHKTGAADVLGRLEWGKPSVTIRTEFFKPEKGRYLHPEWVGLGRRGNVNRALTLAEAALIQGFDDRHLWCGSKTDIAKQIGNAVPPPLARAVAKALRAALRGQVQLSSPDRETLLPRSVG